MNRFVNLPVLLAVLVVAGAVTFVVVNVAGASRLATGPVAVVWDREACAHCRMHVGEPAFAVQLQTEDGRVLGFDDPGCAFLWEAEQRPDVHAWYFHDYREDRWLAASEVAFVNLPHTPMGFGYGAVALGTAGSVSLDEARSAVLHDASGGR